MTELISICENNCLPLKVYLQCIYISTLCLIDGTSAVTLVIKGCSGKAKGEEE